jgi:hypothetical protein
MTLPIGSMVVLGALCILFGVLLAELVRRFRVMRDESRRLRGRL